jgi:hypothetical protein
MRIGKKAGGNWFLVFSFLLLLVFGFFVSASMSSTTYDMDVVATDGGTNSSSGSYESEVVGGIVSGPTNSDNYNMDLGVFYGLNEVPDNPVVSINSSSGANVTTDDLNCLTTINDKDGDDLDVSVRWYKNGVLNLSLDYLSQANGSSFASVLESENTSKSENWSCGVRFYDGLDYSDWVNSSNLTILNSLPVVNLTGPENASSTTDRTPEFNWTGSDADNDSLTYEINISEIGISLCSDFDRTDSGFAEEEYVPTSDLNCLYDNGDYYVWKVRASDDEGTGEWSEERVVYIAALISLKLLEDSINFGSMSPGETNDTATGGLDPLRLENNGTVYVNVSINASALWGEEDNDSEYYRVKFDNVTGKEGAFSWLSSITDWFNMPLTGYAVGLDYFNYSDERDSAEIDVFLEVPANEDPGSKSSTIILKGELAE